MQVDNQDSQSRSMSRGSNRSDVSNNTSEGRENGSALSQNQPYSRNQSVSPSRGSRNSSASSVRDAENTDKTRNDAMNISHEDLSDVSDLESAAASPMNNDPNDVRFTNCLFI